MRKAYKGKLKKISGNKGNIFGAIVLACVTLAVVCAAYVKSSNSVVAMPYTEFLERAKAGEVKQASLPTDDARFTFKLDGSEDVYITDNPRNPSFKEELLLMGIAVSEGGLIAGSGNFASVLGIVFFIAGVGAVLVLTGKNRLNPRSAMALNAENVTLGGTKLTSFGDVAGNAEAKENVADVVDFIKNPVKYATYGARMPRGVIFYGPPGTGKTLMAKAIAGEAGVPFYAVSGSDFVQMYVGVGASRVRELFEKARKDGKAVIFIDEIDALAKKRSNNPAGGNDERDHALNALLSEMSGFTSRDGIVVIAATNRLDTLDDALLRPGRFDRQVEIGLPDFPARLEILRYHAGNKPLAPSVDLDALARQTVFFSGAMLENLLNEAAILAAKGGGAAISDNDIDTAYYIILAGSPKKDREGIKQREREITAYHEAGHALASKLLQPENSVAKVSIIPGTKGAGGFTVSIPPDKFYYTKRELESRVIMLFAGRAAEEITFGAENVTTGAGNDMEKVKSIALDYVTKYHMGERMFLTEAEQSAECESLLTKLYGEAKKILANYSGTLSAIADHLLKHETLDEKGLDAIVNNAGMTPKYC